MRVPRGWLDGPGVSVPSGWYVNEETHIVETMALDRDEPVSDGEGGRTIVTDLSNLSQPFIAVPDRVHRRILVDHCPCDRPRPLMEVTAGGMRDVITLPDGSRVHGECFTHLFCDTLGMERFQVARGTTEWVRVRVQRAHDWDRSYADGIRPRTPEQLDETLYIEFEYPAENRPTASGKCCFTISRLPQLHSEGAPR